MSARMSLRTLVVRLLTSDDGQDLVEYALLTGIVALAAAVAIPARLALGNLYESWIDNVYELWDPPPPSGGG